MTLQAQLESSQTNSDELDWISLLRECAEGPHVSAYARVGDKALNSKLTGIAEALGGGGAAAETVATRLTEMAKNLGSFGRPNSQSAADRSCIAFVSPKFSATYRFPIALQPRTVVGGHFFIRPLLPELQPGRRYFVLALSQKEVRLLDCTPFGFQDLKLPGVAQLVETDLESEPFEGQKHFHSAAGAPEGKKGSVFYGVEVDPKSRITRFLRDIDERVRKVLGWRGYPLILAAVERLVSAYKAASDYPHILEASVPGSPDHATSVALHTAAGQIAEEYWNAAQDSAFNEYREHANTPKTSTNLRKILSEAEQGHVLSLFLPREGEQWGQVSAGTVHLHTQREPGDEELLNLAAIFTLRTGGQVHIVPIEKLPEGADAAAVFRFPA